MVSAFTFSSVLYGVAVPSVTFITSESNRGLLRGAITSLIGSGMGLLTWALLLREFPHAAIILGLTIAMSTTALALYALTWRRLGMRWFTMSLVTVVFLVVAIVSSLWLQTGEDSAPIAIASAGIFVLLWLLTRWQDSTSLLQRIRTIRRS